MEPRQAWGVLGLLVVLADMGVCAFLWTMEVGTAPVVTVGTAVVITFGYIAYKRYNVEVMPEKEVMMFDDPSDLALLCRIYGLDQEGDMPVLRARLVEFVRRHRDDAFVWVAPKAVMSLGNALSLGPPRAGGTVHRARGPAQASHIHARPRSDSKRAMARSCPVCDADAPAAGSVCGECGADLRFCEALSETRVGRLVLSSKKARAARRKLRYEVPPLGGLR